MLLETPFDPHHYTWNHLWLIWGGTHTCWSLTCAGRWFTLQRQCLKTPLIQLQLQVGQVLLHFLSHLGIFIQMFGTEEGTLGYTLFVPALLSNL